MQIAYSLMLFIVGTVFARLIVKSGLFSIVTGYLWGVFFSVLPSFISMLLFGGVNMPFYFSCNAVLVAVLFVAAARKGALDRKFGVSLAAGGLCLVILAAFFTVCNCSIGSMDSVAFYIQPGMQFFLGAPPDVASLFSSVGALLSLAHGPVVLWGDEYYYLLHPLLFVSLCLLFFLLFYELHAWRRKAGEALLWVFFTGWVLSSFFVLFHVFYVHTNMPSAIYLFLAASCYTYALKEKDVSFLPLYFAALFAFSLLRVEAPFFAASAVLFSGVFYDDFKEISPWWLFLFVMPLAVWNLRIVALLGGNEGLAGPFLLGGQALGLIVLPLLLWGVRKMEMKRRQLQKWSIISMGVVILALSLVRFDNFAVNIVSVFSNLFFTGRWGSLFWGKLFIFILLFEDLRRDMVAKLFLPYVAFYFLTLLLLGFMRVPYRLGWGDSLNRMMITVIPLLSFYLFNALHRAVFRVEQIINTAAGS